MSRPSALPRKLCYRFPHENTPTAHRLPPCAFRGDLPTGRERQKTTSAPGKLLNCCILYQPSEPDFWFMSQVRRQQRPEADNGHYQQKAACHGPSGDPPATLTRLLTMLICAPNIGAAASARAGYVGELYAQLCVTVWSLSLCCL